MRRQTASFPPLLLGDHRNAKMKVGRSLATQDCLESTSIIDNADNFEDLCRIFVPKNTSMDTQKCACAFEE